MICKKIFICIVTLFICACNQHSSGNVTKNDIRKFAYNIDITNSTIHKGNVKKGENVGGILNKHGVSFLEIDKIAKLSRKVFDLRDVKAVLTMEILV